MPKIKILGAGWTGSHYAHAARQLTWDVVVCDADDAALKRMEKDIFPNRFGRWDPAIKVCAPAQAPKGGFEYIAFCTPADQRISQAMEALEEKPQAILLDRPACPPSMELAHELLEASKQRGVEAFVGYELGVGRATEILQEQITGRTIGDVLALDVEFREHWEAILKNQPWVMGIDASDLGFWDRGGGASGEHSHALFLWQLLAHTAGQGRVSEVGAMVMYAKQGKASFDAQFALNLRTEKGFSGRVVQDFVTRPTTKRLRLQGVEGRVESSYNHTADGDCLFTYRPGAPEKIAPAHKKRTDDFLAVLRNMWMSVKDRKASPISLERGLDTAMVIAAAHESEARKSRVKIDWTMGYTPEAIVSLG